jgi:hypothetical protein
MAVNRQYDGAYPQRARPFPSTVSGPRRSCVATREIVPLNSEIVLQSPLELRAEYYSELDDAALDDSRRYWREDGLLLHSGVLLDHHCILKHRH